MTRRSVSGTLMPLVWLCYIARLCATVHWCRRPVALSCDKRVHQGGGFPAGFSSVNGPVQRLYYD